jgi:hypothetical protein
VCDGPYAGIKIIPYDADHKQIEYSVGKRYSLKMEVLG